MVNYQLMNIVLSSLFSSQTDAYYVPSIVLTLFVVMADRRKLQGEKELLRKQCISFERLVYVRLLIGLEEDLV